MIIIIIIIITILIIITSASSFFDTLRVEKKKKKKKKKKKTRTIKGSVFLKNIYFIFQERFGPPWYNYRFSFTLAYSRISHEYSSLFIIVINLIFMFSL